MNRQDHALVQPTPGAQGRPRGQGILGVDDAGAASAEAAAQRAVEEHLVPVPIPDDARRSAGPLQDEGAHGEDGDAELPAHEWDVTSVVAMPCAVKYWRSCRMCV